MKKIIKTYIVSAVVMTAGCLMQSCQSEAPFSVDGEGRVRLNVEVDSRLTRAVEGEEDLKANARIYISNEKGVLNKWVGVQNIPSNGVALRYGSYVAEAMAGDSVPASFSKKYFKGASEFTLESTSSTAQVSVACRIANVVASIDESTIDSNLMSDLKVVIGNSKGELTYAADSIMDYGYYMMPSGDTSLTYTITGVNNKGTSFTKTGEIKDVQPAHNYRFMFEYNPSVDGQGGAFLTVIVADEELYEDEVVIVVKPAFSWAGNDPAINSQIIGKPGQFIDKTLRVYAYNGFRSLTMTTDDSSLATILGGSEFELTEISEAGKTALATRGVTFTEGTPTGNLCKYYITFTSSFLNSLPERATEYVVNVEAVDINGKKGTQPVRIANTDEAIVYADPIIVETELFEKDFTAVSATSASIPLKITNPDVENPMLQYRASGAGSWESVPVSFTRADIAAVVKVSGLTPSTVYEYRLVAGNLIDGAYEFESGINSFTTESKYIIPNASFEDWGEYTAKTMLGNKTVIYPGLSRESHEDHFWDSGNEGAATANKVLTNKSTDMVHSGTYSARLASDAALGIIAAGNIFTGYYVKTDGTNGVLSVGHTYDGSHPSKLRVYANYRPGDGAIVKGENKQYVDIVNGGSDHGQIYVALTTAPIEIRTNPSNRKLFDKTDMEVLAYGEVTWKEAFGQDGQLQLVEIPLGYNERAKTNKPTHLVIVCSASKFGDYFCGSSKSVMYLDDFELVYE